MKTSIIISCKISDEDRAENLRALLKYLSMLISDEVELIVVEQDTQSRIEGDGTSIYRQIKHVFIKNEGTFNKGLGYNVGAKVSSGEYLIFTDIDLYIEIGLYLSSLSWLVEYDVVNPYTVLHYLDKENSRRFFTDYDMGIVRDKRRVLQMIRPGVISGGIFAISRGLFFALKGFDERCAGYGYEDDILDTKMRKTGVRVRNIEADCIHAYHKSPRDRGDASDEYYSFFDRNKNLYRWYMAMTREQVLEVIDNVATWGEADYEYITH